MTESPSTLGDKHTTWILNRAREGRQDAMNELLRRLVPRIEQRVRREKGAMLSAHFDTQDFSQDVAMELLEYLPRVEFSDSDALERYLYAAVRNTLIDATRRLRQRRRDVARNRPLPTDSVLNLDPPAGANGQSPSQVAQTHEYHAWIRLALPLLGPDAESIFIRRKLQHEPTEAIAADLGITEAAARMRIRTAEVKLVSIIRKLRAGQLADLVREQPTLEEGGSVDGA